jgi:mannose-6-phosphate isomerase-like protein (cupin superfamily)
MALTKKCEYLDKPHIEPKKWGAEVFIWNDNGYCGKILKLRQAHYCSYHMHKQKDEIFCILQGKVLFILNGEKRILLQGDRVHIKPGDYHGFEGLTYSEIMEVSTTHSEDDSYRKSSSGKRSRIVVDIDGVLAEEQHQNIFTQDYAKPKLVKGAVAAIKKLRKNGAFVILHTSRTEELRQVTKNWLHYARIEYDDLVLGKPSGDVYIDDRALRFESWKKCLNWIQQKKL